MVTPRLALSTCYNVKLYIHLGIWHELNHVLFSKMLSENPSDFRRTLFRERLLADVVKMKFNYSGMGLKPA